MGELFQLCWINREGGELVYHVRGTVNVGRAQDNEISVDEEGVSRRHCRLTVSEETLQMVDLGSTNGTFVNGKRVQRQTVVDGDEILVGRSLFRVRTEAAGADPTATLHVGSETIEVALRAGSARYSAVEAATGRAEDHLRTLCGVIDAINTGGSAEDLYRQTLDLLLDTLDMDSGAIILGTDPKASPALSACRDDRPAPALSRTVLTRVLTSAEAVLANDISTDSLLQSSQSLAGSATARVLCAPIAVADRVSGALYLTAGANSRPAAESELRLVSLVARELALAAENLRRQQLVLEENKTLRAAIAGDQEIVGSSESLRRVSEMAQRAARSDVTVLITGETGTGKELYARAIHEWSPRQAGPFIAINCGAIPDTMVESELFGHEKGAFTGAVERRLGKFELARDGTLFLDEIGELPLELQVKLLRVLEDKRFFRVGGSKEVECDVRVVAATNRNLTEEVGNGRFREDLLYRIRVLEIAIPPLRDRPEDIAEIADHLLARLARVSGLPQAHLDDDARQRLTAYSWPGNVRELRNALERALILSNSDTIEAADILPPGTDELPREGGSVRIGELKSLKELERNHIQAILDSTGWNKTKAADILGIGRTNIYEKIRQYELKPPD